ncbi:MAG: thioredoxin family protein [Bacilli bacterium]|nr:thioredoxin family protein [Bacilli bacterium]
MTRKKKNIIISAVIIVLTVIICAAIWFIGKGFNKTEYPYIHELTFNELESKLNNQDSFVLIITQTGCSHCEAYLPVVQNVSDKYKVDFYVLNRTNISDEERTKLKNIANISGTPTTLFYTSGEEKSALNRLVGQATEYRLVEKLTSEGYIHE